MVMVDMVVKAVGTDNTGGGGDEKSRGGREGKRRERVMS